MKASLGKATVDGFAIMWSPGRQTQIRVSGEDSLITTDELRMIWLALQEDLGLVIRTSSPTDDLLPRLPLATKGFSNLGVMFPNRAKLLTFCKGGKTIGEFIGASDDP